jgi:hypothetical protein
VHQVGFNYTEAFTSVVRNSSECRRSGTVSWVNLQERFDTEQRTSVLAQADSLSAWYCTLGAIGSYLSCILGCPCRSFLSWFSGFIVTQAVCFAVLSPQKAGFNPRPVYVVFMVEKVTHGNRHFCIKYRQPTRCNNNGLLVIPSS